MRRKTLDLLLNWVGLLLTVMLLVAGTGLVVGYSFTSSQVKSQLLEQKVFFPTIFANDIIGVDTTAIAGGKTYAQLSAASLADPSNTALANQVNLVFRGDTLRGLLLNAYAFGFIGVIALYASIASFALALLMLILTLLGVRHYRQGDPSDVI